jgi:hypothetical protein
MTEPVFAVVGHPNKGKSSLVATLARDASVAIGPDPGTTIHARRFPMRLGGEVLYALVDTPGFQRARAALDWMKRHERDAASRPAVVARFVEAHSGDELFRDECELLRLIVGGAAIIYVVDGASPYGPEYDAEMEILRWTGRPSMAIINPIGGPRFVDEWRAALEQFFRAVRVLDVLEAPFAQQIELLRVFGHLAEDWREPLERATDALVEDRRRQRDDAARVIAELIGAALTHIETKDLARDVDPKPHAATLEERYRGRLRQLERQARADVEAIYGYDALERSEPEMELLERDLLAQETWLAFGLTRRDVIAAGAVSGAVAGGVVDAAFLGASFLTGSIIGGVVGGALGWYSSDKLTDVKVLHQPLGGQRLRCGPTKNVQFPFVLLGRARLHHALVAARTHARRDALIVAENVSASGTLDDTVKRELAAAFDRLRRCEPGTERYATALVLLTERIAGMLEGPNETE